MSAAGDKLQTVMSAVLTEKRRLAALSNEDLVRDYLKTEDADAILHVEEMITRLWPDWHKKKGGEDLTS